MMLAAATRGSSWWVGEEACWGHCCAVPFLRNERALQDRGRPPALSPTIPLGLGDLMVTWS